MTATMNPYVIERINRYKAARQQIEAMQTRAVDENRDLTDEELRSAQAIGEAAKKLYEEIGPDIEEQERSAKIAAVSAQIAGATGGGDWLNAGTGKPYHPAGDDPADGLLPLLPSREQLAEVRSAIRDGRSERFTTAPRQDGHNRAVVTTALAGVPVQALTRPFMEPRRLATTAGLGIQRVEGVSTAAFPIFGAGSAEITAEGALKQEYAAITPGSAVPQMINAWTDFTRQLDMSMSGFETRLRSKLAALVAAREDKLLVATALALTLPTFAKTAGVARSDALLQAASTVVSAVGMAPNVAVVNPADVAGIFTGSAGAGGESPEAELRLAVRGMTVYPCSDIASGTALVGAWPAGAALLVGLDPTYLVDAVSGIKNNKVTVLLEEAVALAVDDVNAFVKITTFTN